MRVIFVRHGHPDYENDCLTELGHAQAKAVAKRLSDEPVEKIFSSACGRAVETAGHIASLYGLEVEKLDFMNEISWASLDGSELPYNGNPWYCAYDWAANGKSIMNPGWGYEEPYCRSKVVSCVRTVGEKFDELLLTLGYKREGEFYRPLEPEFETVMMVSHGGSSSAVLSHLFNLPFSFVSATMGPDFTAISVIRFDNNFAANTGELISPEFELLNDSRHIRGIEAKKYFGN